MLAFFQTCSKFVLAWFQTCSNFVLAWFQTCSNFVLALFQTCSNFVLALFQTCSNFVLALFQKCSNSVLALFQTCSNFVLALFQTCSNFVLALFQTSIEPLLPLVPTGCYGIAMSNIALMFDTVPMLVIVNKLAISTLHHRNHKWQSQPNIWSCKCNFFSVYRPYKESITKEMNNDNDLNLHSMTKLLGWLRYWEPYLNGNGFSEEPSLSVSSLLQAICYRSFNKWRVSTYLT